MGSLAGHALPGAIFIFYGLSWIALSFWLHLTTPNSQQQQQQVRKASYIDFKRETKLGRVSYIPQPFCSKIPLEPLIKIVLSCVGILCETFADIRDGHFVWNVIDFSGPLASVSRLHHITMYGAFLMSGLVDLIGLIVRIPRNMTKLFLSLALFIEGLLFWYHTHDKEHLSIALHSLLIIVIFIALFLSLLRILQPSNVIINSLLGTMLLIQGTWFIHVGTILYGNNSTTWSLTDEASSTDQIMFAVVIFNWHVLGNMFLTLVLYVLMLAILKGSIKYKRNKRERGKGPRWITIKEEEKLLEQHTQLLDNHPQDSHKDTIL